MPLDEGKPDEGHEAPGNFVECRADAPALLEPSDTALDYAPATVGAPVVAEVALTLEMATELKITASNGVAFIGTPVAKVDK